MSKIAYRPGSPYASTPQTSWYLELLKYRDIGEHLSDKPITIDNKYNLRPDKLSYDRYGTRDFWWVFQVLNMDKIRDPIYDFTTGTLIYAPTRERLFTLLGNVG